jgi:uncharacterized protein YjbI with pentapeptide repeats
MSKQDGTQATVIQRPITNDDKESWIAYWKAQGQPWRTESEIDLERQKFLTERRSISPSIEEGIYPFKDIEPKMSREDVEWLLTTHENGRGPVDWSDENQRQREGLDLRGADLSSTDLSRLPLACTQAGLTGDAWFYASPEQARSAAANLDHVILIGAHLEGAKFNNAILKGANLYQVYLEGAEFKYAVLEGAYLNESRLGGASFTGSHLEGTDLRRAHLEGISTLPTNLRNVFFDNTTKLWGAILGNATNGFVRVADISWGGVNLALLDLSSVNMLGDERKARGSKHLDDFQMAVRANRQLAVALQTQGLNEIAARFAYRAQKLQRVVFRRQRKFGQYLFSGFLDLLAGYGYRPGRSVFWYFVIIFGFALAYFEFGHLPLLPDAFVFSLTSFHGRGFFPGLGNETTLHNPLVILAAVEAVIGLFIEISFIATFTKRFFGN